jgi:hypothetical protein
MRAFRSQRNGGHELSIALQTGCNICLSLSLRLFGKCPWGRNLLVK